MFGSTLGRTKAKALAGLTLLFATALDTGCQPAPVAVQGSHPTASLAISATGSNQEGRPTTAPPSGPPLQVGAVRPATAETRPAEPAPTEMTPPGPAIDAELPVPAHVLAEGAPLQAVRLVMAPVRRRAAARSVAWLSGNAASAAFFVNEKFYGAVEIDLSSRPVAVPLGIAPGSATIRCDLHEGPGGTGARLATGTVSQSIAFGKKNDIPLKLHGIVAQASACWNRDGEDCETEREIKPVAAGAASLWIRAWDATGAEIDRDEWVGTVSVTSSDGKFSRQNVRLPGQAIDVGYLAKQTGALRFEAKVDGQLEVSTSHLTFLDVLDPPDVPVFSYWYRNAGLPQGSGWNQIVLGWKSDRATSFDIWVGKRDSKGKWSEGFLRSNYSGTSFLHTGLQAGAEYYYWVLARNAAGESSWSSWVGATIPYPVYRFKRRIPDGRDTFCYGSDGDCSSYTKQFDHPVFMVSPDGTGDVSSLVSFEKAQDHILVQGSAEKIADRLALDKAGYGRRILGGYAAAYSLGWLNKPLYRASSIRNGVGIHLFTLNGAEISGEWSYEGITAWVILP